MSIYRTRNATSINTIKNSLSDILPSKSQNSLERAKFEQSQVQNKPILFSKYSKILKFLN